MKLEKLEQKLGYTFANKDLLHQALTHPSKGYESKKKVEDNQRMEFLGDAVLQLALTICLYRRFPEMDEGHLTKLRAQLVNRSMLDRVARSFNLGEFLILGRGEEMNQGRTRTSNLANAMEAVIGAIFQDSDFSRANEWVVNVFEPHLEETTNTEASYNPKGELQELLQGNSRGTPVYEIIEESGPDHARHYIVAVKLNDIVLGRGEGASKRAAETVAAAEALKELKQD